MYLTDKQIERFWRGVDRSNGPNSCWPWKRSKSDKEYPRMGIGENKQASKVKKCSHVALLLDGRPKPYPKAKALHTCHYPPCCNALHLYWGTSFDNMRDKVNAGHMPTQTGEANNAAKLTTDDVYSIRQMFDGKRASLIEIGNKFQVSKSNVWAIGKRDLWPHLPELHGKDD